MPVGGRELSGQSTCRGPGFAGSPAATLGSFFTSTNVDGMKDLWCSNAVRLLSTQI